MDQKTLREFEAMCIQEEFPECRARCPLHVDVRLFLKQVADGKWSAAWKVLQKTMPFPAILGRICDHPCEDVCKRKDVGGSIRIGALERACVRQPAPEYRPVKLPPKNKKIAVAGSGLSSLTASRDLILKGYEVILFEAADRCGGLLRTFSETLLPADILLSEIEALEKLGLSIKYEAALAENDFLQGLLDAFDAVYVGFDTPQPLTWHLQTDDAGKVIYDPATFAAAAEGVFVGGGLNEDAKHSPISWASEGRRAAVSIDRFVQNVSMNAGREKEGPFQTRLFTRVDGIAPLTAVPMADPAEGYGPDEAVEESRRCLQCECMECVKVCPYLEFYKGYPKRYAREIYNNLSIVQGMRQANLMINSCSYCGLCETVCPENFSMADFCAQARHEMTAAGKMPPSAHEFALLDMAFNNSEKFAMNRHEPGTAASTFLFFPGCQLSGSASEQVKAVYQYLRETLDGGVGLMLRCCGAPASWAARDDLFQTGLNEIESAWSAMGRPEVIVACSTCLDIFKRHLPDMSAKSLWKVLEQVGLPDTSHGRNAKRRCPGPLAVHDPCTTREAPSVQQAVRLLLERLDCPVEELSLSREKTECCGFGGLMSTANPDIAKEVISRRAHQSERDYLAYCAMCRDRLASTGKRVLHLLDLMFPQEAVADPAAVKPPGFSERHENRARLKNHLLTTLWNEKPTAMDAYEKIELSLSPDVQARLEERRILVEDIQQVIYHAEKTQSCIRSRKTGHLIASFKPYNVTFWIEYSPVDKGFAIHNAYCHRMEIIRRKS